MTKKIEIRPPVAFPADREALWGLYAGNALAGAVSSMSADNHEVDIETVASLAAISADEMLAEHIRRFGTPKQAAQLQECLDKIEEIMEQEAE